MHCLQIQRTESKKAEEFISHEEILETLKYADENKEKIEPWVLSEITRTLFCNNTYAVKEYKGIFS